MASSKSKSRNSCKAKGTATLIQGELKNPVVLQEIPKKSIFKKSVLKVVLKVRYRVYSK